MGVGTNIWIWNYTITNHWKFHGKFEFFWKSLMLLYCLYLCKFQGLLSVWSLLSDKNPVTSVESHQSDHDPLSPKQLVQLFKLDAAIQDFKFYTG